MGPGSPKSPGGTSLVPKKDDGKKKLQQFMHNARKVSPPFHPAKDSTARSSIAAVTARVLHDYQQRVSPLQTGSSYSSICPCVENILQPDCAAPPVPCLCSAHGQCLLMSSQGVGHQPLSTRPVTPYLCHLAVHVAVHVVASYECYI